MFTPLSEVPISERKCKSCECWIFNRKSGEGVCKARAPIPGVQILNIDEDEDKKDKKILFQLVLPATRPEDGCIHDFVKAEA
jgi:hypothetical protein